jgi:membrane protein DedA with SNARE-associated domain
MDLWDSFWSALAGLIADNGLVAVAFIVLLRSAAVPIPVPADLLVMVVGARAREQQFVLWPAWLVLTISTTVGAALFYAFVRWIGQGDVSHYGRYVGLTTERLNSAETQLVERGTRAVFVARIVPGLRLAIVAVCGMLRFRWWNFVAAVVLGGLVYVAACLTLGYIFGDEIVALVGDLVFPLGVLEPVLGLSLLLFWLVRARRSPRKPTLRSGRGAVDCRHAADRSGSHPRRGGLPVQPPALNTLAATSVRCPPQNVNDSPGRRTCTCTSGSSRRMLATNSSGGRVR